MHYDLALRNRRLRDTPLEHDWDAAAPVGAIPEGRSLESARHHPVPVAGRGPRRGLPFQFVEGEYMLQEEYDEMLADPARFAVRKLWPRVATTLAPATPYAGPAAPDPLLTGRPWSGRLLGGELSVPNGRPCSSSCWRWPGSRPEREPMVGYVGEMAELGYPMLFGATALTAFDCVSDFLRGLRGTMLDMYQVPDKLLAAIEVVHPWTIEQSVALAHATGATPGCSSRCTGVQAASCRTSSSLDSTGRV